METETRIYESRIPKEFEKLLTKVFDFGYERSFETADSGEFVLSKQFAMERTKEDIFSYIAPRPTSDFEVVVKHLPISISLKRDGATRRYLIEIDDNFESFSVYQLLKSEEGTFKKQVK
jgi:hypothetical protein